MKNDFKMKRRITIASILFAVMSIGLGAQNVTDALRFSENEYYGTARSVAMGNAFTALGGDLGSVSINPAGSAVQNYSQITLTPQINIMAGTAEYSSDPYGAARYTSSKNSRTTLSMPNFGTVMNFSTGRRSGVRSFSLGFVANATRYFDDDMFAGGENGRSSYMGYLADIATMDGLSVSGLNSASYRNSDVFYWPVMVAYRSGMINEVGSGENGPYVGLAQSTADGFPQRGTLSQSFNRISSGYKYDLVLNFGMNIDNRLYLGANLGMVTMSYAYDTYHKESALNPADFPVTIDGESDTFQAMKFHYAYNSEMNGIYGKFGFIFLPFDGLRIGGAIQTPTLNNVSETLWYSADTRFGNHTGNEVISENDEYYYTYQCVSPMRFNLGVAYTLPGLGCFSFDYERCDYATMKLRDPNDRHNEYFEDANAGIRDFAGASDMFRIGAEFNLTPAYSLRGGYTIATSAERYWEDDVQKTPNANKQSVAFGMGYKSKGSFFFDLACRMNIYPTEYIYPYDSYAGIDSPEIINNSNLWNVVATFGFRF